MIIAVREAKSKDLERVVQSSVSDIGGGNTSRCFGISVRPLFQNFGKIKLQMIEKRF
jgi:hypothetical protein